MDDQVRLLFHELVDLPTADRQRIITERQITGDLRVELQSLLGFDSLDVCDLTSCVSGTAEEVLNSVSGGEVQECGPYKLVRLLGRGGMGAVYLGERGDGEIQQTVAVKLLNADGHRPGWRDRFLKERQLLASLNHPSIVHVIDAGHTGDGRPYLVMEYVEGVSIDLHASATDVRERLILFLRVCDGVSHAHRRLIIHRDLKPSNILVDVSSQPKLLDFGIAKLLDDSGDATRTVDGLLTPNYASPEQLRGTCQTTATDIYSLGAVLYKILTGRSPHESDTRISQVVDVIAGTREIPAPSRLNPKLPPDLDYILRKALRTEPEERYASVDAFANDIRAFLGSRPVEARSGDTWYRTRKFLRRYWVPVVAAMLVIASLAAGLYIANRERLVAEQRFGQLRQLSNKVFDLDKTIRDFPGSTQARQSLVSVSLQYLEGLAGAARGDLDLAREIGQGYWRVGRIQGVPVELNLGQRAKSEASLKKAAEFVERVVAARAKDRSALYLSALIANDRMILAQEEHRYADALAHAHESAGRLDAVLRLPDGREVERAEVANLFGNVAFALVKMRRYDAAIPYARREVELMESIPSAPARVNVGLISWAGAMDRGDLEAAYQAVREGRQAAETGAYPTETMRVNELYGTLLLEGLILDGDGEVNLGRTADAERALQKALDLAGEAARKDPNNATSRAQAAKAGTTLANILRHENPQRSLVLYDVALQRLSAIRNSLPVQRDQALALANSSYPLRSLHRAPEARQRIDAAFAILKDTNDYPAEQYYLDTAAYAVICALADHQAEAGDTRRALETFEQLLAKTAAVTDFEDAPKLSRLYESLMRLYRKTGDPAKAESMKALQVGLWQNWDRKLPNNAFVRRQMEAAGR
jgi:serine/threonine protein kinase/tetratricopeptide (TPR) repeat protein